MAIVRPKTQKTPVINPLSLGANMAETGLNSDLQARMPTAFMASMRTHNAAAVARNDVVGSSDTGTDTCGYGRSHLGRFFLEV
jgi:hypothetical protein